jgi:hypothetical protein
MSGRRLRERRGRLRAAGPVCSEKGCSTVICAYNGTEHCFVHGGWMERASYSEQRAAFRDLVAAR